MKILEFDFKKVYTYVVIAFYLSRKRFLFKKKKCWACCHKHFVKPLYGFFLPSRNFIRKTSLSISINLLIGFFIWKMQGIAHDVIKGEKNCAFAIKYRRNLPNSRKFVLNNFLTCSYKRFIKSFFFVLQQYFFYSNMHSAIKSNILRKLKHFSMILIWFGTIQRQYKRISFKHFQQTLICRYILSKVVNATTTTSQRIQKKF